MKIFIDSIVALLNLFGLALLIFFLGYLFEKLFKNVDKSEMSDYNKNNK